MKWRHKHKRASLLLDALVYLIMGLFLMTSVLRLYLNIMKDYRDNLLFLKHSDYAYHTFETLKRDFYINTESIHLVDDILYIKKLDKVNAPYIMMYMQDGKLRYTFGTKGFTEGSVYYLCYDLQEVSMKVVGHVLFIELVFPDVSYERGFLIEY